MALDRGDPINAAMREWLRETRASTATAVSMALVRRGEGPNSVNPSATSVKAIRAFYSITAG
jgi:hypothetical protein